MVLTNTVLPMWELFVPDSSSAPQSRDRWPRLAPPAFSPAQLTPRTANRSFQHRPCSKQFKIVFMQTHYSVWPSSKRIYKQNALHYRYL